MFSPLVRRVEARWQRWLTRNHPPIPGTVRVDSRHLYVFPNRAGAGFALLLAALFVCAVNYELSLVYLLTFLLLSVGSISVLHTIRTVLGLQIMAGAVEDGFAGDTVSFSVWLVNESRLPRRQLQLMLEDVVKYVDVPASGRIECRFELNAIRRGKFDIPRLRIISVWPLGIFRAWTYARFDKYALVYPKPENPPPDLPAGQPGEDAGARAMGAGLDDFAGLRPFMRGDSPRHIAWRAAARDDTLPVKRFEGIGQGVLWFDFGNIPLAEEARLARLCAWVLKAAGTGVSFGLRLPGKTLEPGLGEAHRLSSLRMLALFGQEPC